MINLFDAAKFRRYCDSDVKTIFVTYKHDSFKSISQLNSCSHKYYTESGQFFGLYFNKIYAADGSGYTFIFMCIHWYWWYAVCVSSWCCWCRQCCWFFFLSFVLLLLMWLARASSCMSVCILTWQKYALVSMWLYDLLTKCT